MEKPTTKTPLRDESTKYSKIYELVNYSMPYKLYPFIYMSSLLVFGSLLCSYFCFKKNDLVVDYTLQCRPNRLQMGGDKQALDKALHSHFQNKLVEVL